MAKSRSQKLDPASLDQLRREAEKIPPQSNPRAEKSRRDLLDAVKRLEGGKRS